MESKRLVYLDLIKVFAMFLVCFYHFGSLDYAFVEGEAFRPNMNYWAILLTTTGVPLFFMTSGALLLNKKFVWKKHSHRIVKTFVLFLIWKFITVLILAEKLNTTGYGAFDYINLLFTNSFPDVPLNHFWFIYALLTIYLILPVFKYLFDFNRKIIYYILFVLFAFAFGLSAIEFFYSVFQWMFGLEAVNIAFLNSTNPFGDYSYTLFYFLLGGIFGAKESDWLTKFRIPALIALGIIGWSAFVVRGVLLTNMNDSLVTGVFSGYTTISTILIATSIFLLMAKVHIENEWIKKQLCVISNNTLGIYFIHWIVGYLFITEYYELFPAEFLWVNIKKTLILLFASLFIAFGIKRLPIVRKLLEM